MTIPAAFGTHSALNRQFCAYWYDALHSPTGGLYLRTSPQYLPRLRAALYQAQAACEDPAISALQLSTSRLRPADEVWLLDPTKVPLAQSRRYAPRPTAPTNGTAPSPSTTEEPR